MTERTLTPAQYADQLRGATRVAPGIWIDRQGGVHFSIPELLALVDLPDTPANRAEVVRTITRTLGPDFIIQELES